MITAAPGVDVDSHHRLYPSDNDDSDGPIITTTDDDPNSHPQLQVVRRQWGSQLLSMTAPPPSPSVQRPASPHVSTLMCKASKFLLSFFLYTPVLIITSPAPQ